MSQSGVEVYRNFFQLHEVVISGPNIFTWGNGIGESFNHFKMKQKVPLKTYCGIRKNDTKVVRFEHVREYDGISDEFHCEKVSQVLSQVEKVEQFLTDKLQTIEGASGIDISFIAEIPKGHGFGFLGVASGLIAYIMHYIEKQGDVLSYDDFIDSDDFVSVHNLAWDIADLHSGGKSTGSNSYTMMCTEELPIVYASENIKFNLKFETQDEKSRAYKENIVAFSGIDKEVSRLPVDYCVVHFGVDYDSDAIFAISEGYQHEVNEVRQYILRKLEEKKRDKVYAQTLSNEKFYDSFVNVGTVFHFQLARLFEELFQDPRDDQKLDKFIDTINQFGAFSSIIETENYQINKLKDIFQDSKVFDDEVIGVYPLTIGKSGGTFVLVTKFDRSRRTVMTVLEEYAQHGVPFCLEYCSWSDGYTMDGIMIEQDIGLDKFSTYVSKDASVYFNNRGFRKIGTYAEHKEQEIAGILFDAWDKKIYVDGKKLTSKDLKSQTATIELFEKLIENIDNEVYNNDLPYSSYSKGRNQMMGKIVLPIAELVEKHYGIKLPLECKGSLHEFYLKLGQTDIPLNIIKPLH